MVTFNRHMAGNETRLVNGKTVADCGRPLKAEMAKRNLRFEQSAGKTVALGVQEVDDIVEHMLLASPA
jgi:hypothetical protein